MTEDEVTNIVIGCCIEIHKHLGPGLLEAAYEECLHYELTEEEGLHVERQKAVPLIYNDIRMDCGYRVDFLVENKVVVEVKAVEAIHEVHRMQTITYLKLTNCKVGLLINFNVAKLKDGIKRFVNNYERPSALTDH